MRKISVMDPEEMQIAIQQEIQRSEESRYDHKLHGVLLVAHGYDSYKVADMLGQDPTTVQRWIKRFNESGFAGLRDGERPGEAKIAYRKAVEAIVS
jgi:transposase